MKRYLIGSVSGLALATLLGTAPALAQGAGGGGSSLSSTVTDDTTAVLSAISSLPQSTFDANLATAISINNSASAERQAQATADASMSTSSISTILGSTISTILSSSTVSAAWAKLLAAATSLTSSDASWAKSYFGTLNAYGTAYGVSGQNPRPYQVSSEIQLVNGYTSSGSSFPSGHSTFGFTTSLLLALALPEAYQALMVKSAEYGTSRIVLGVHYPLDVTAARIIALKDVVALLANATDYTTIDYYTQLMEAITEVRAAIVAACGTTISACLAASMDSSYSASSANAASYLYQLTYGLTSGGSTTDDPVVPENAQLLLVTRFPYLTADQRTEVLATTETDSGSAMDDGTGWARLNLYAAAGGYGSFRSTVTVTMDASQGGYYAADTWSNDISGVGGLIKEGTGALTLSGANTYTGDTTINGGTLRVTGSITSATTVNSGGTLAGSGSVGQVSVTSGGILAPGGESAVGTLTVNGDLSLSSGSTYAVRLSSSGIDATLVNGSATLSGASLSASLLDSSATTQSLGSLYQILYATGGITGTFSTTDLSALSALLTSGTQWSTLYATNSVTLAVTPSYRDLSSSAIAATGNHLSLAQAITEMGDKANPTTDQTQVLASLYSATTTAQASHLMDEMSGASRNNSIAAAMTATQATTRTLQNRMTALRDGRAGAGASGQGIGPQFAFSGDAMTDFDISLGAGDSLLGLGGKQPWGLWGKAFGQASHVRGDGNAQGFHATTGGAVIGLDRKLDDGLTVGASGSITTADLSGGSEVTGYRLSPYGSYVDGPYFADLTLGFGLNRFESRRDFDVNGEGLTARGHTYGNEASVALSGGYHIDMDQDTAIEPLAGLTWAYSHRRALTESGAGSYNLVMAATDTAMVQSSLGGRLTHSLQVDETMSLEPQVRAAWLHDFADRKLTSDAQLAGITFQSASSDVGRDGLAVGFGVTVIDGPDLRFSLDYDAELRRRENDHTVSAGLKMQF